MDDADLAQRKQEQEEELRRLVKPVKVPRTGNCLWCEDPVAGNRAFCNLQCSQTYDYNNRFSPK
jgi:hypothetical protein